MGRRGLEVGEREQRVRGRLDPDEVNIVRRRPRLVELDEAEPPRLECAEGLARAVVGALREPDRASGAEQREDERRRRPRTGGEEEGMAAVEVAQ